MQYTPHIRLPLFESADKPTWLYDWNETMMKLDDTLFNMSSADMPPEIASMLARIEALERTVSEHTTSIETLEADVTSILADIANLQSAIDRINALIPSNASPSNQLATMADVSGGGQGGHDFNSDDFSIDQNEVSLLDDRRIVELTGAEYDALSQNEKMNGSAYFIKDRDPAGGGNLAHYHLTALPQEKIIIDTNCISFKNFFGTLACKSGNGTKDWLFPIPFGQYEQLWVFIENHDLILYNSQFGGYSDFEIDLYFEDLVKTA